MKMMNTALRRAPIVREHPVQQVMYHRTAKLRKGTKLEITFNLSDKEKKERCEWTKSMYSTVLCALTSSIARHARV